jgi:glycosyltransferase involved in cell wall biosynthesis
VKSHPLVSVIIPCYNVSAYVGKAIQSILEQTYSNLEIWIIDDASTDDTLQNIYSFKDKRIRVIEYKQNTQKVGAVNDVLEKVNGDFICFQDADDWSEPGRIEMQVACFHNTPSLGICFTNYEYTHSAKKDENKIPLSDGELKDEFLNFRRRKNTQFAPTICATMMITKEVLDETRGYHNYFTGRVAEDIHWVYRILKKHSGVTINKPFYHIQQTIDSLTHDQSTGKSAKSAYAWQLLSKIIYKDIYENIDVLAPANESILKTLELEACEEALVENIKNTISIRATYEQSSSYKLGRFLLSPLRPFRK